MLRKISQKKKEDLREKGNCGNKALDYRKAGKIQGMSGR